MAKEVVTSITFSDRRHSNIDNNYVLAPWVCSNIWVGMINNTNEDGTH